MDNEAKDNEAKDNEAKEVFVAKIDAFAATLNPEEQAMFIELLAGDDEVTGFGTGLGWPGVSSLLADAGIGNGVSGVQDTLSAGNVVTKMGGTPEGVFIPGRV